MPIFVLLSDNNDIGFIIGNIYQVCEMKYAKLDEICVIPSAQKKGYGKVLVDCFEKKVK